MWSDLLGAGPVGGEDRLATPATSGFGISEEGERAPTGKRAPGDRLVARVRGFVRLLASTTLYGQTRQAAHSSDERLNVHL
jgi:hypothetical protein